MARIALLAILVLAALAAVSAHSWLDCADWRFNDPAALTTPSLRRWGDADGVCYGHARKFPVLQKPFGKMDEVQFFRHYVQPFSTGALACRNNAGTTAVSGSSEGTLTDRTLGYTPNKDPYGEFTYGLLTTVKSGQTLCMRWPAKNHFAHVDITTNPTFINWDDVPNRPAPSLTQAEMDTKRVATFLWANCPVPGPASNGDSSGVGSELRPCGNCFTVPQRAAGVYTVQWVWPFKDANSETYTSCADIKVEESATTVVNCAVSAWSDWGTCSSNCGSGTQKRTRTITANPTVTGTACPTLTDAQACNTQSCASTGGSTIGTGISAHVVYENSLVDFTDWSWAAKSRYSLASTTFAVTGTSIMWKPYNWEAIYFNYNIGQVNVKDYQSIYFWINGGTSSGQYITFSLVTTGRVSSPLFTYPIPRASIKANTWTKVSITFSDLKLINGNFDGFWFQANGARSQPAVYIDDIYFMHVHAGGPAAAITTDPCASVSCSGNSACLGGQCYCTNGYYGDDCMTAGSINSVTVKNVLQLETSSIDAGSIYLVEWSANGTLPVVSVLLYKSGSDIPEHLATQVSNQASYTWTVPASLAAGTYTVRVQYSRSVYGDAPSVTKTSPADLLGCSGCNGHGTCDEDTAPDCVCRYNYTGSTCGTAPKTISKQRVSIIAGLPISLYNSDSTKAKAVLIADLAAALYVETDQIEIASVSSYSNGTSLVSYDLVSGGAYKDSTLAISSQSTYNARLAQQLATADSNINRATYTYAMADSGTNAAPARAAASTLVAAVLAVVVAAVIVL